MFTFILGAASAFFYIKSLNEGAVINSSKISDSLSSNKKSYKKQNNVQIESRSEKKREEREEEEEGGKGNKKEKKGNNVRIYVDGCWDLCHSGHYNAIRQAKALGDHLVVGVHSCEEIARNKRWPIMSDKERMACIEACKWVDQVVFDVPYSPSAELLDRSDVSCDYVAHGDDIAIAANGKSAYHAVESRLKIFKRTPGVSTTKLIDRLIAATKYQELEIEKQENNKENDNEEEDSGGSGLLPISKENKNESQEEIGSWSQFLSSSYRISAFSNNRTPGSNDKVVYIDGIFDLFHAGHIAAIKEAKKEGTFLYVGLFDDETIRNKKGSYFPLMGIQERTLNVLSCKFVDEVIIACPWNITKDMINVLNIDSIVTCDITNELSDENNERYNIVKKEYKNMFKKVFAKDSQLTTNDLMKRIAKDQERMKKENENRVKKEMAYMKTRQYVKES